MVSELNIVRWTGGLLWSHFIDKHTHIVYREREARCNYDELIERERERERVGWESDLLWSSDRSSRKRERRTSEQTGAEQSQENWKRKKGTELNWKHTDKKRKTNAPGWGEREREKRLALKGLNDELGEAPNSISTGKRGCSQLHFNCWATHTHAAIYKYIYRRLALYLLSDVVVTMEAAAYRWPKG